MQPIHQHKHLPYQVDETASKGDYYELYWKKVGLELLQQHAPPTAYPRLLDYGCGRGEMLKLSAEAGYQPTGCDPDPRCVELSSKHGSCHLLDLEHPMALFSEECFDIISCFHVLEHVPHPSELLEYFQSICTGYLIVAVPNLRTLRHFRHRPSPENQKVNQGHVHGWDHDTFLNLMTRHLNYRFCGWAHDTTILPLISPLSEKLLGQKQTIKLETTLFKKMFPFHCHSIIGLFKVPQISG